MWADNSGRTAQRWRSAKAAQVTGSKLEKKLPAFSSSAWVGPFPPPARQRRWQPRPSWEGRPWAPSQVRKNQNLRTGEQITTCTFNRFLGSKVRVQLRPPSVCSSTSCWSETALTRRSQEKVLLGLRPVQLCRDLLLHRSRKSPRQQNRSHVGAETTDGTGITLSRCLSS